MTTSMIRSAVIAALAVIALAGPASADPIDPAGPDIQPVAGVEAAPPADDGRVASTPPITDTSPDGWIMTVGGQNEVQLPVPPLTTAISTREYQVSGTFIGSLKGPGGGPAKGVLEVGYQIGCGIDMSTSNGVSLTGTAGINPSIGYFGFDFPGTLPDGLAPGIAGNLGGGITVGLKPGIINNVPVTKKEYKGSEPWVSISNYHVKIDGCVGESFIRSYATLTKSTELGDAILSWWGVTKAV